MMISIIIMTIIINMINIYDNNNIIILIIIVSIKILIII